MLLNTKKATELMSSEDLEKLKFPIGKFIWKSKLTNNDFNFHKEKIANYPTVLNQSIKNFNLIDFKKVYRPGGWQVSQLIHHLADSHTHSYIRFKQAIIEDTPTIMDYKPDNWAKTADSLTDDVSSSMNIIKGVHYRWSVLLNSLKLDDLSRKYYHPNRDKYYPLHVVLALYSWHGDHHLAHIRNSKYLENNNI